MINLSSLLVDPYGHEVAWDLCLEQNICIPDMLILHSYYGLATRSGKRGGRGLGYSCPTGDKSLSLSGKDGRPASTTSELFGSGKAARTESYWSK